MFSLIFYGICFGMAVGGVTWLTGYGIYKAFSLIKHVGRG